MITSFIFNKQHVVRIDIAEYIYIKFHIIIMVYASVIDKVCAVILFIISIQLLENC